jgi:Thiamine pyrophosphate enzyme, central domain
VAETAGAALARILSAAGVGAAYGRPLAGLPVRPVSDPRVALLLAHAHRAVHAAPAVAHLGNGTVAVAGARSPDADPGASPRLPDTRVVVDDDAGLAALAPAVADAGAGTGLVLQLDLDPDAPVAAPSSLAVPDAVARWQDADAGLVAEVAAAGRVVVLAGPGVVTSGAVGGLHALAAAGRLGVLNTWGAKGVFHWQSPHHWATVGLQERDFELGGLADADLVLAVGIDEREAPPLLWARYPHRVVAPASLGALAAGWRAAAPAFAEIPPLRARLAAVTQAGWASTAVPLVPSLVTRHYAQAMGDAGLVAADAGRAGFWVARTFATPQLGAASVPAGAVGGWAAACVLVARLVEPLRRAVAVVDGAPDDLTTAVLEEAARHGVAVGVEAWQEGGEALGPEAHRARLEELAQAGGVVTLATDGRQLAQLTAVAGPVRAWTGDIQYPR